MTKALVIVAIASLTRSDINAAVIGLGNRGQCQHVLNMVSTGYIKDPDSFVLLSQEV